MSELFEEVLILSVDLAQLGTVLPEGCDLLLLLLLAQHLLLLQLRLLGSELLEADLLVLLLLIFKCLINGGLGDLKIRVFRMVVVGHMLMLGELPVNLHADVERAIWAPWPALKEAEIVDILDLGEILVRLRLLLRFH